MIDWYYHGPAEGRVGPLSAEELRQRYLDRRIQRDTLVWHQGLREWQPLERMALDIGLDRMQQDASKPPPLPSNSAIPMPPGMHPVASRTTAGGKYSRAPLRQKKTLPTGAIVLIVVAVVAIPALLVMGSVMLPAYQDYARRATSTGAIEGLSNGLKQVVGDYAVRTGRCPSNDDPRLAQVRREIHQRFSMDVRFASIEGGCAFEVAIDADGKPIDGKSVRYEGYPDDGAFVWQCDGGDLPGPYRPHECRNNG